MIIRITQVTTIPPLTLQPGDEIHVKTITPALRTLVESERIDRAHVAEIVNEDEYAVADGGEAAIVRGRRSRVQ